MFLWPVSWSLIESSTDVQTAPQHHSAPVLPVLDLTQVTSRQDASRQLPCPGTEPTPISRYVLRLAQMSDCSSHVLYVSLTSLSPSLTHFTSSWLSHKQEVHRRIWRGGRIFTCGQLAQEPQFPCGPSLDIWFFLWCQRTILSLLVPELRRRDAQRPQIPPLPGLRECSFQLDEALGRDPLAWGSPPSEGPSRLLC